MSETSAVIEQLMLPWRRDERYGGAFAWVLHLGTDHIVTMAKVESGWMWKWERGCTLTVGEQIGFTSSEACEQALWHSVFELVDRYFDVLRHTDGEDYAALRSRYNAVVAERDKLKEQADKVDKLEAELALYKGRELSVLICNNHCGQVVAGFDETTVIKAAKEQGWNLDPHLCAACRPKATSA